ncbi:MAG: hypothetical protein ACI9MR_003239 [Myxococcota bacterium]|jgi:hypothetical protein
MWFAIKKSDIGFVDTAKHHFTFDFQVAGPPELVFDAMTAPEHFAKWFPDYRGCRWVSEAPHGRGSQREVALKGLTVMEHVLVYDRGERFTFTLTKASVPLLSRMVEDFRLDARPDGGTRVQWTVAYQPKALLRPVHRLIRPTFGRMFEKGTGALQAYVATMTNGDA